MAQPPLPGVDAQAQYRLTEAPRRYGWHATLKAPFALAPGVDVETLRYRLNELCGELKAFTLPPLTATQLDDFLALVPAHPSRDIDTIAATCATGLQELAAPLSASELQRRRAAGLTPEEDALLLRWGYPFVLDHFRFHLSLTGPLRDTPPDIIEAIGREAAHWFGALPACRFESVALFAEPHPGADFVLVDHVELAA